MAHRICRNPDALLHAVLKLVVQVAVGRASCQKACAIWETSDRPRGCAMHDTRLPRHVAILKVFRDQKRHRASTAGLARWQSWTTQHDISNSLQNAANKLTFRMPIF